MYDINADSLYPYCVSNPKSLSESNLEQLEQYQIFSSLNPVFYYTNCFIYTLEQQGVPRDKICVEELI